MSVGHLAGQIAASAAGTSLAQRKSADVERSQAETLATQRTTESQLKAEAAAGIEGTNNEQSQANDRDADGRSPWRQYVRPKKEGEEEETRPKDPSGQTGSLLDLSG